MGGSLAAEPIDPTDGRERSSDDVIHCDHDKTQRNKQPVSLPSPPTRKWGGGGRSAGRFTLQYSINWISLPMVTIKAVSLFL
jgi:hypothetical protein